MIAQENMEKETAQDSEETTQDADASAEGPTDDEGGANAEKAAA